MSKATLTKCRYLGFPTPSTSSGSSRAFVNAPTRPLQVNLRQEGSITSPDAIRQTETDAGSRTTEDVKDQVGQKPREMGSKASESALKVGEKAKQTAKNAWASSKNINLDNID